MASFLKNLRGNGDEIRELANRIHEDRQALEDLIAKAEGAARKLGKLNDPITKLNDRLAALERQISGVEERIAVVGSVRDQANKLLENQRQIERSIAVSRDEVGRLGSQLGELGRVVDAARGLKGELTEFCETDAPLQALKSDAEKMRAEMGELTDGYDRLRQTRDDLVRTTTDTTSRLVQIEQENDAATRGFESYRRRVEELEGTIGRLGQVAAGASDTKHQLLTLKSLADQITQKAASLENQRDAVERAARDVSRLDDLVHEVDAAIREQESQISNLHTLATELTDLRSLYDSVATRSKGIIAQQQLIEERERGTQQKLSSLGEQLGAAVERFELEHRGLETVSNRVLDLRTAVRDCEERMNGLDASSRAIAEVEAKADKIWTRLGFFMGELEKMNEMPERLRLLRSDATRLHELMQEMAARGAEVEKAKPAVEAAVRDLATLGRTHEAIKDALDQMRVAQEEMARVRSTQTATEAWLEKAQVSVTDLRARVQQIDAARPIVESVHHDVERLLESTDFVTSRRQFLDEVQARLGELAALAAQLDDRTKAFRSRLDIAEGRFVSVTRQAQEAERIAGLVTRVVSTVTQSDARLAEIARSITALEARSHDLQGLREKSRLLGVELDQRQATLDKASEHLARASTLRQEAADTVRQLEMRAASLQNTLGDVEKRTKRLEAVSVELDGFHAKMRSVESGVAQFEKQRTDWELAKSELERARDQVASRQSTVDALQTNITEMFEVAERTANDLRAAVDAQREIRESRESLDELIRRVHEADAVSAGLEQRKDEIEQAERRLARAEALLIDIQSSLEVLNNQKALLDRMIAQAGSLTFQIQQAEAVIERLRKERDVATVVRAALDDSAPTRTRSKPQES